MSLQSLNLRSHKATVREENALLRRAADQTAGRAFWVNDYHTFKREVLTRMREAEHGVYLEVEKVWGGVLERWRSVVVFGRDGKSERRGVGLKRGEDGAVVVTGLEGCGINVETTREAE